MALGTPALFVGGQQGQTTMRPNGLLRMQFALDASYPAGGYLLFADTYLKAELGREVTPTQVVGYGFTAGAITHIAFYAPATDALQVFILATGAQVAGAVDLSAVTFDVEVHYR